MRQPNRNMIFISYSHKDALWLGMLKDMLAPLVRDKVELGHWDDTRIEPGARWAEEIRVVLSSARVAVLLVSPNFLDSKFIQIYELPQILAAARETKITIIWVYVSDCNYGKTGLAEYQSANPLGKPLDILPTYSLVSELRSICDKIEIAALQASGPPLLAMLPPIFKLPFDPNPHFTGRGAALAGLRAALTSGSRSPRAAITGMGGVGKTQLAVEYAYAHMREYKVIWWLRAENAATLANDYAELAPELKLPESEAAEQRVRVEAVKGWLERNGGWLLVFDNVPGREQVADFVPRGSAGHVIFTSRNPLWASAARPLPVAELARAESAEFLLKRTGQDDQGAAGDLAAALGDLPLALEQAGAYIEESALDIKSYLGRFLANQKALLERASEAAGYPASVASTLGLSLEDIRKGSLAGVDLLNLCAFLAPTAIPLRIIGADAHPQHLTDLPDSFAGVVGTELPLNDAAMALRRYSLAELRDGSLSLHKLTQAVVRDRLPQAEKARWAGIAFSLINCAFPQDHSDVGQWPTYAALLPHALAVAGHALDYGILSYALARLMKDAADYLMQRAEYARARELMERALGVIEKLYGADSPKAMPLLDGLGNVARSLGDLDKAREYSERALSIGERTHGADSPELAVTLHNLGSVLIDMGKFEEARPLFERAVPMHLQKVEPHLLIQTSSALGLIEFEAGNLEAAEKRFRGVLGFARIIRPPGHLGLGEPLNNLAVVLTRAGKHEEALALLEEVLIIHLDAYGPDHPAVATIHNNLGRLAHESGDLARARTHFEKALAIRELQPAPNPMEVALVLNNLGQLLVEAGDATGREYLGRALRMHVEHAGEDHPISRIIRNNYSLAESGAQLRKVVKLDEEDYDRELADLLGAEESGTGDALKDKVIGLAHYSAGNYREAVTHLTRAIEQMPEDAILYKVRGACHGDRGDFVRALPDFEKAVELEPDNSEFYDYLGLTRAKVLWLSGDTEGALRAFDEILERNPNAPEARRERGLGRFKLGQWQGAVTDFSYILRRNPRDGEMCKLRGQARYRLGSYRMATADLESAWGLMPDDPDVQIYLAMCHLSTGAYDEAVRVLAPDLKTGAQWGFVLLWRAVALVLCGRQEEAPGAFARVLLLTLDDVEVPDACERERLLGRYYLLSSNEDESREHYAKAVAQNCSKAHLLEEVEHAQLLSRLYPSEQVVNDVKDWLGKLFEDVR